MEYIIKLLEKEKQRKSIIVKEYPNGMKYVIDKDPLKARIMHSCFKPLDDTQSNKLLNDVNAAQKANYTFPNWYRDFLKTTNGLNVFMGVISFYGEQTPLVEHPKYGLIEAGIGGFSENPVERENWMAPYNLRFTNSVKFELNAQNRWLTIGSYHSDGTQIVWDLDLTNRNLISRLYAWTRLPYKLKSKV